MPAVKELEREDETRDEGKKDSSNSWPDTGGRDGGDGLWVRIGAGSEDEIAWLDEKRADRRTVENDGLAHTRGWDDGGRGKREVEVDVRATREGQSSLFFPVGVGCSNRQP